MARPMEEVCRSIHQDIDEIIDRWVRAAEEEPWFTTPKEEMIDELPAVVRRLADVALLRPGDEAFHREKVRAAARHGDERREQGIPTEAIFREYHFLRVALWRYLDDRVQDDHTRLEAITRIDMAISVASRASLYGYHRPELEERGDWPERIEQLSTESNLLARLPE